MKYRIMKLICMFDLPTDTPKERKEYRSFRKRIIEEGFSMIQYSVYVRTCPHREHAKKIEKHIKRYLPDKGNIRLLMVTEKQYDDMRLLVGCRKLTEERVGSERLIII